MGKCLVFKVLSKKNTLIVGKMYISMFWTVCSKTASQYSEESSTDKNKKPKTYHICTTCSLMSLFIVPIADTLTTMQLKINHKVHTCHCVLTARCQSYVCADAVFASSAVWRCDVILENTFVNVFWTICCARMSQASPGDWFEAVLFQCISGFSTTVTTLCTNRRLTPDSNYLLNYHI